MWTKALLLQTLALLLTFSCLSNCCFAYILQHYPSITQVDKVEYQYLVEQWLTDIESDLSEFNSLAAHLTWKLSTSPDDKTAEQANALAPVRNSWKNKICDSDINNQLLTEEQRRKLYLLCRGPKFSDALILKYLDIVGQLAYEYNREICISSDYYGLFGNYNISSQISDNGICFYGEPDLERMMKRRDLSPNELKWIWLTWHNSVGPRIKDLFITSVAYQNLGALNNGYHNMGEIWREELEIPNLEEVVINLYEEVKPLYVMLHAVVRHKLFLKYGPRIIDPTGLIPVHLLGNMWGQDWTALMDLFVPSDEIINFDARLKMKNITVRDMVLEAEDFYTSLSFPKMTKMFWKYSVFEENNNISLCHGTAANLYSKDDFRMLMCGQTSLDDMYVIHHEMGHVEYYMAYEQQSAFFQDGTNTAFHESVGDSIWHAVLTPQHLHRLKLISDEELGDENVEFYLLLYQALNKLPELPFSLLIDIYRWRIFDGSIKYKNLNKMFWELNGRLRGVAPPEGRSEAYFDAGAKFHVPDNTPYIRYFLSGILQLELFKSMCEAAFFGGKSDDMHEVKDLPLHRCDIYGSKRSGKLIKKVMGKGSSIKFAEALKMITGKESISTKPFLEYYAPVYKWLKKYIDKYNVFVGW